MKKDTQGLLSYNNEIIFIFLIVWYKELDFRLDFYIAISKFHKKFQHGRKTLRKLYQNHIFICMLKNYKIKIK